eukprot:TRINITY_DN113348_c0_g1_i1.p1 TRINITY_DN113348_c0_g1~~TRINITY_DN113348_c0_g1_i1.p1  ORF type:complete len:263 (+),score=57.71 TRINITY_DN113348_c0_g1_i1:40-828(+)
MMFDDLEDVLRVFDFALPVDEQQEDQGAGGVDSKRVSVKLWGFEKPGGDIVWLGARILCAELLRMSSSLRGAKVMELGASSGLPAALSAALGAHTVATDGFDHVMFGQVPLLAKNTELFSDDLALGGSFSCAALDWGLPAALEAVKQGASGEQAALLHKGSFDFVIASEVVYMPCHIPELAETIDFFLAEGGQAIIANTAVATSTTQPEARRIFVAKLEELGFRVECEIAPEGPIFKLLQSVDLTLRESWSNKAYLMRIRRH